MIDAFQGIMETFAGLGYTAGPLIGGVLYDYGGFQLPFFVLGVLLLVAAALSCFLIEQFQGSPFALQRKNVAHCAIDR